MSTIRKSLIRRVAAWYLLSDAVRSACKWGPGQKVTDEERRVASIAALEAQTKQTAMPVSMEEGWRSLVPTPEELDADVRKLAGVIALHGVEVLKHPDQFAEAMKAKPKGQHQLIHIKAIEGLQEQIKKLEAEVARLGTSEELPWSDCKVVFPITDESDLFWDAPSDGLPPGWDRVETDGSGTRTVGIFCVDGPVRAEDGAAVVKWIKANHLEDIASNGEHRGSECEWHRYDDLIDWIEERKPSGGTSVFSNIPESEPRNRFEIINAALHPYNYRSPPSPVAALCTSSTFPTSCTDSRRRSMSTGPKPPKGPINVHRDTGTSRIPESIRILERTWHLSATHYPDATTVVRRYALATLAARKSPRPFEVPWLIEWNTPNRVLWSAESGTHVTKLYPKPQRALDELRALLAKDQETNPDPLGALFLLKAPEPEVMTKRKPPRTAHEVADLINAGKTEEAGVFLNLVPGGATVSAGVSKDTGHVVVFINEAKPKPKR